MIQSNRNSSSPSQNPIDQFDAIEFEVHAHEHCALCGSKLHFDHQVNYVSYTIEEKSHCPSCNLKMKARVYTIQ